MSLISAMMLTGSCRERIPLARWAIDQFLNQTYFEKELIILNHGDIPLVPLELPMVREIMYNRGRNETLGELRNEARRYMRGDWILHWDDDDWRPPDFMRWMFGISKHGHVVKLKWHLVYDVLTQSAHYQYQSHGFPGPLFYDSLIQAEYRAVNVGEDADFVARVGKSIEFANYPGLYVRICHGFNTLSRQELLNGSVKISELTPEDNQVIIFIISELKRIGFKYDDKNKTQTGSCCK